LLYNAGIHNVTTIKESVHTQEYEFDDTAQPLELLRNASINPSHAFSREKKKEGNL
jgi:hypothetical protein